MVRRDTAGEAWKGTAGSGTAGSGWFRRGMAGGDRRGGLGHDVVGHVVVGLGTAGVERPDRARNGVSWQDEARTGRANPPKKQFPKKYFWDQEKGAV